MWRYSSLYQSILDKWTPVDYCSDLQNLSNEFLSKPFRENSTQLLSREMRQTESWDRGELVGELLYNLAK